MTAVDKVLLVGPSASGKTTYLASLMLAAFANRSSRVRVDPANPSDPSRQLMERAYDVLEGKKLPATSNTTRYEVCVRLAGSVLGIGRASVNLSMIDPPGGDCLPNSTPVHPDVLGAAVEADAILVIIPSTGAPPDLGDRLRAFSGQVRAARKQSRGPLFARVATALTMAELLPLEIGPATRSKLDECDSQSAISQYIGRDVLDATKDLVAEGGDWYSCVSVFGFDEQTGLPSSIRTSSGWGLPSGIGIQGNWRPYHVFEPIEFLVRGVCWGE